MEPITITIPEGLTVKVGALSSNRELTVNLPEIVEGSWIFRQLQEHEISPQVKRTLAAQQRLPENRRVNIIDKFRKNAIEDMFQEHMASIWHKYRSRPATTELLNALAADIAEILRRYVAAGNLVEKV
jgi:hypothetical protein